MSIPDELVQATKEFDISNDQLRECMDKFLSQINKGLGKDTHDEAVVKAFVTYVQDLPTGELEGKYIGLDVGGSNFRVILAHVQGKNCDIVSKAFALPPHIFTASREEFFDLLAQYIAESLQEFGVADDNLPMGLTFSFPLMQKGLKVGVLERWTKKFNIAGVIGQDVVQLLNDSLSKRGDIKVNLVAVLNDTTGTLVSCAFEHHHNCCVGMILGTGTNACYMETQENAQLFDEPDNGSGKVVINTEWGAFGDNGDLDFIRLDYDNEVDGMSINPKHQLHEKMISAMYLGEITRLALKKYMKQGIILKKKCTCPFTKQATFKAKFVSMIEAEPDGTYNDCRRIMKDLGVPTLSDDDCAAIKYVCSKVSTRAGVLCAAGLSTLVNKMNTPDCGVGIDGAFFKNHPKVGKIIEDKMKELVNPEISFEIHTAEDGSGKGAALVAAVAKKE